MPHQTTSCGSGSCKMSHVASSTPAHSLQPVRVLNEVDQLSGLVHETTSTAEQITRDWDAVRQSLGDIQKVVDRYKQCLGEDVTVELPPGAAAAIKDLTEGQARIAASASDVVERLDLVLPDFAVTMNALEARVQQLSERSKEVDNKYKALLMPREGFLPPGDASTD